MTIHIFFVLLMVNISCGQGENDPFIKIEEDWEGYKVSINIECENQLVRN